MPNLDPFLTPDQQSPLTLNTDPKVKRIDPFSDEYRSSKTMRSAPKYKNPFANIKYNDFVHGSELALAGIDALLSMQEEQRNNENQFNRMRNVFTQQPIYDYNYLYGPGSNGGSQYQPTIMAKHGAEIRQGTGMNHPINLEGSEFIQLPDMNTEVVNGPSHENGGVNTNLPNNSRVFSDTLKPNKKSPTFAKLAKKYDTAPQIEVLNNPFSDEIAKNTAQLILPRKQKALDILFSQQQEMNGNSNGEKFEYGGMFKKGGENKPYINPLVQMYLESGISDPKQFLESIPTSEIEETEGILQPGDSRYEKGYRGYGILDTPRKTTVPDFEKSYLGPELGNPDRGFDLYGYSKVFSDNPENLIEFFKQVGGTERSQTSLEELANKFAKKNGEDPKKFKQLLDVVVKKFNKEIEGCLSGDCSEIENALIQSSRLTGYPKLREYYEDFSKNPNKLLQAAKEEEAKIKSGTAERNPYFPNPRKGISGNDTLKDAQETLFGTPDKLDYNNPTAKKPQEAFEIPNSQTIKPQNTKTGSMDNTKIMNSQPENKNWWEGLPEPETIPAGEFTIPTNLPAVPEVTASPQGPIQYVPYKTQGPKDRTPIGNQDNTSKYKTAQDIDEVANRLGYTGPRNNKALQQWLLDTHPDVVKEILGKYGDPAAKTFVDGFLGVRFDEVMDRLTGPKKVEQGIPDPKKVKQEEPPIAKQDVSNLDFTIKSPFGQTPSVMGDFDYYQALPEVTGFIGAMNTYPYYTPDYTHFEIAPPTLNIQPQLESIDSSLQSGIRQNTGNPSVNFARNSALFNQALAAKQQAFGNKQNYDAEGRFKADQYNFSGRTRESELDINSAAQVYNELRATAKDNASTERQAAVSHLTNKMANYYQDEYRKMAYFDTLMPNFYYNGKDRKSPVKLDPLVTEDIQPELLGYLKALKK